MLSSTLKIALLALLFVAPSVSAAAQRLLDCTLDSKAIDDCDVTAYAGRLAGYAIVGLLFGIFTLLTCPFYFSCRYCCNCCGGRSATMGCCCACGAKPAVYSTMDIVRPKVYVIFVIALAVGSCAWGYFSTSQTTQGMRGLVTAVNNTPQLLLNQLNLINDALIIDQYDPNTDTISRVNLFSGTSLQSQGEDLKKQMSDALSNNLGTVDTYIGYFSTTMNVLFAVPIVIVIVAALCAVCNIRTCIPMLSVALMFLMGFLIWTCHGIFNPLALVTGDLCAEIHGLTLNQKTILKPISQCNDTMFSEFLTSFTSIEQSVAGQACTKLQSLCYDNTQSTLTNIGNGRVYDCGSGFSCSNVRFGDVLKIMQSGMVVIASVSNLPGAVSNGYVCGTHTFNCTPVYCAGECRVQSTGARSDVGKLTQQMYTTFLGAQQVSLAFDTLGGQYGSCDALMQLVLNPFDSGCQDLSGGALSLRDATGLVGVTSFGFIFILAWGSKRFLSLPETEDTKEYEMSVPVPAKNPLAGYDSKPASPRILQVVGPAEHSPKQMDEV